MRRRWPTISSRRWVTRLQPSPLRRQGPLAALRDPDSGPAFAGASGYQRNIYAQNRPDRRHELGIDRNLLPPSQQGRAKRSEEHTSELQSLMRISYAVFCLKKKKKKQ